MNFMLFLIKFIKFKQRIKFKKFELHNYGAQLVLDTCIHVEVWELAFAIELENSSPVHVSCEPGFNLNRQDV